MIIKEINSLPIYKQMSTREKWRNYRINEGHRKQKRNGDLIANKGSGVIYIIENTALLGWFKTGIVCSEENFKTRMQSYKSIIPIGEWNVVYFEHTEDSAKEELKIKQFFRFECEYEMGINSNEWFKGDWKVMNKIDTLKNIIDYTPQRVCQQKYAK
jgi:hypothetical protein